MCVGKVKADPDKHPAALRPEMRGQRLRRAHLGRHVPEARCPGQHPGHGGLKATKKTNAIRATVDGEKDGETIKVKSLTLD
jgi:hypothetical protein